MGKIQVDAATAEALKAAQPGAELVGPDGQPIGGFVPRRHSELLEWAMEERRRRLDLECRRISVEELRALDAAGGEIPHDEVIDRLGLRCVTASSGGGRRRSG